MTVTQLIKGKPKYGISKVAVFFFGYTIRSKEGAHGSVFFSSSAHSQALYILRTILQSSAHSSLLGPNVSFKFKKNE